MRQAPVAVTVGAAFAAGLGWLAGLRVNLTWSLPAGIYAVTRDPVARGAVVLTCLPPPVAVFARLRGYVPRGSCPDGSAPLGKLVLAVPADTVTVSWEGLSVNGASIRNSRALLLDSAGRPLPRAPDGLYTVSPGEIWLVSAHPSGFDSRYFGPLPASAIRAVLRPVWTADDQD